MIPDRPDDNEPLTCEWLVQVGGEYGQESIDLDKGKWSTVRIGPLWWYTNLWTVGPDKHTEATYFLKYSGACLLTSDDATRGKFRMLCGGLDIPLKE